MMFIFIHHRTFWGQRNHRNLNLCWYLNTTTLTMKVTVFINSVHCSVVSDSLQCHGLQPARLLCPWDSLGKNPGVGSHSLLQGIFPTQGSNPGLTHCRHIFYSPSYQGHLQYEALLIEKYLYCLVSCFCMSISVSTQGIRRSKLFLSPTLSQVLSFHEIVSLLS